MLKSPGGEVAFWSILWIFAGTFLVYSYLSQGQFAWEIFYVMLPIGCGLIWLDIRPAKWLVVTYLSLAVLGAVISLASKGFSWSVLAKGGFAAYTAILFATWIGNPKHEASSRDG